MPNYRFGKGPISVTLENLLADRDKAMQLLRQLYDKNIKADGLILADALEQRTHDRAERNHFNNVFGDNLPADTPAVEKALAEREGRQRFTVFREGMRLATLLVLGLDPKLTEGDLGNVEPRETPFLTDFYWACGQPFNETWVSWHTGQNDSGYVSVTFLLTLIGTNLGQDALKPLVPEDLVGDRGLVVCHANPNGKVGSFTPIDIVGIPRRDRRQ
jgi:hypothetical protein